MAEEAPRRKKAQEPELGAVKEDELLAELAEKLLEEEGAPVAETAGAGAAAAEGTLEAVEIDAALAELEKRLEEREKTIAPREFFEYTTFECPAGYQELERYWVAKPFAWVAILFSPERNERLYHLVEPSLTPAEKTALEMLYSHLLERLTYTPAVKDRDKVIADKVMELLHEYGVSLDTKAIRKLLYYLKRNYIGYGEIDALLRDINVEDISCDGVNVPLFLYHRRYQSIRTNHLPRN